MASEEIGGYILMGVYGLMLIGAVKVFGLRRVLWFFVALTVLGLWIGIRTVTSIASASSSRY
ncbi:MAG: hypothetical protein M3198_14420 [Actinomycetota bacterium]|nr:hypothetical protein [Actinomycetota bacterium]